MEDRSSRFLNYLLTNKRLTREQKREISQLLVRDLSNDLLQETETELSADCESVPKAKLHDVKPVFDFLHLFTEKEALKYTTHDWDKSPQGTGYCFANYTDFKQKYLAIIEKHNIYNSSKELWELTKNFLLNDDGTFYWSRHKIKIGYNKYVKQWMEEHPDEQPGLIDNRSLSSFRDVVEIFKHCIEFRDEDLYDMIMDVFDKNGLIVNMDIKSISIYTCTEKIKEALEKIAENAFNRGKRHPHIEVNLFTIKGKFRDTIVLEILQVDSFPDKAITDDKVFSVESKFVDSNNNIKGYHIDYLVSEEESPLYYEIPNENIRGYKSILRFYSYHNEKGNNNRR